MAAMLLIAVLPTALLLPSRMAPPRMAACVEEFTISKDIKSIRVFDDDYAAEICEEVTAVGVACIAEKDSFSLAIPGGSVVAALAGMEPEALDFTKVHIFLCNEKIPSFPCISGALEVAKKLGIPDDQVYGFGEGAAEGGLPSAHPPQRSCPHPSPPSLPRPRLTLAAFASRQRLLRATARSWRATLASTTVGRFRR